MLRQLPEVGGGGLGGRVEDAGQMVHPRPAPPAVPVVDTQPLDTWVTRHVCHVSGVTLTTAVSCLILVFFSILTSAWKATSWLTGNTVARQVLASDTTAGSVGLPRPDLGSRCV